MSQRDLSSAETHDSGQHNLGRLVIFDSSTTIASWEPDLVTCLNKRKDLCITDMMKFFSNISPPGCLGALHRFQQMARPIGGEPYLSWINANNDNESHPELSSSHTTGLHTHTHTHMPTTLSYAYFPIFLIRLNRKTL